jgi:dihydropteroate synthase-like protein
VTRERIHFITGRLAEFALVAELRRLAPLVGFDHTLQVLPITVAALMTTNWIARRIEIPPGTSRVILPGYCQGDLVAMTQSCGVPVERGPHDLRRLADFFGHAAQQPTDYGSYDIEILAEINHAPRLSLESILSQAEALGESGADWIDVGCEPGDAWSGVGETVRALVEAGHRVSIDSMNPVEIAAAVRAGARLVLSVNSINRHAAPDWGCEVVAVPDVPSTLAELENTVEFLAIAKVPLRIDPILEPIGFGFAASLGRYLEVSRRYPDAEMLMGIGNLTELTEADSAAINVLLLGFCQEQGIRSVLTTQVINWARSSVRECDLARRLVHYATGQRVLPKHLDTGLVMLRDPAVPEFGAEQLDALAGQIRDHNYRIFAEQGQIHVVTAGLHLADVDPFLLFERMAAAAPKPLDAGHAFYLGYEMAKAATALTLAKDYRQDEALDWGFLTAPEQHHRLRRTTAAIKPAAEGDR